MKYLLKKEFWKDFYEQYLEEKYYCLYRFVQNVYYFVRYDFIRGIINLIKWFPIIWNDRNWDGWYLNKIVHKKLLEIEKAFKKDIIFVGQEEENKNIQKARECIERSIISNILIKAIHFFLVFFY